MTMPAKSDETTPNAPSMGIESSALLGGIGIASVLLSKRDGWSTTTTMTMHWREGVTDVDTMRGLAVAAALESKPGFAVEDVLVKIIMPNDQDQTRPPNTKQP